MKTRGSATLIITLFFSLLGFNLFAASYADYLSEGDREFGNRTQQTSVEKSIKAYKKAIESASNKEEEFSAIEKYIRAYYWYGTVITSWDERKKIFAQLDEYSNRLIQLDPTKPAGYHWAAASIMRWGEANGVLRSLRRAKEVEDFLLSGLIQPDGECYEGGGIPRLLGFLYLMLPTINPFGPNKDVKKAHQYLEMAFHAKSCSGNPLDAGIFWVVNWVNRGFMYEALEDKDRAILTLKIITQRLDPTSECKISDLSRIHPDHQATAKFYLPQFYEKLANYDQNYKPNLNKCNQRKE